MGADLKDPVRRPTATQDRQYALFAYLLLVVVTMSAFVVACLGAKPLGVWTLVGTVAFLGFVLLVSGVRLWVVYGRVPMEEELAPEAVEQPRFRFLTRLRRISQHLAIGSGVTFAVSTIAVMIFPHGEVLAWFGAVFALCAVGWLYVMALRLAFLYVLCARFSLGQFMGMVFVIGFLVSLIVSLPGDWKLIPALIVASMIVVCGINLIRQDPSGERAVPEFVRSRKVAEFRERMRARREAKFESQPSGREPTRR